MKFSEDSSGVLRLNSTSNKTVKEYDCQKVGIKHSSAGDVCDVVVSQKNINESKESSSDRQMTFTSAGSHSNHSNLHSSSEYPQKARRSLLDWDSFINLPKKPRNLSLKTDDLSRTLVTKTTDSRSPIKSKQEGDSRASPCLSPIKANEFVGNVKLAPLRCSTEHDKLLTNGGYSSSEEHHSKSVPARGGESSDFSSPDFTLSSIPVKNRAETRKRRSSHFATASNDSEVSSDQLDIHSQRQNQNQILIGNHNSKKRKLSPSVRIRRTKDTFTCIAKENLHNGVQSPDFAFDTSNSIHCQKVSCRSPCGACDHENHISNELNLRELSGSTASQQNHSLTNNSFTITHVATQRPSLRLKKSSKLPKEELISTQNQSNLANKSVFQCLYCTRPFSEKRYRLKHMIACRLAPKNLTKKKLHEIGRMYESSSISSGSPNLVNNVDEEISISNGVICQANQTLQNGHSDEIENTIKKDKNSPQNSYQNNPKMNHDVDSQSNPITPFLSTTTNPFINSDDSLKTDRNTLTTNTFDSHLVTKRSENNLSSNNNEPYESDENIWQNYRPSYGGPYTCSFCYRVIHNRSNFSRHIASCKARISLSTRSTPKPKPAVRRNKRKFHFVFTPTHKVTPQLKNSRKELLKGGMSNTELNKVDHRHSNGDADNNEIAMNSGDKSLDPRGLSTLDKNVTDLVNSEDSQHDCTDEHLFSTGCHQDNPTEDEQKNRMSPSTSGLETSEGATTTTTATTTMTTTTTTGKSSEQDVSNENLTATPFKCNMCSLRYRHRTSLLRHARQSNHQVDLIRTRKRTDYVKNNNSGIRKSGECLNGGGCMDNEMVSNLTWKEYSESVKLDSKVVENENIGQVVDEVDHRHSNGDADNNEIAMNSGDKSLDPRGLSTLDKNVTDLVNSEDSQHDCTDEHLFSTGCHQDNPTESDENIWQNYRPSYGGPYTCSFCYRVIHNRSNFSRHIASCKARISLSTRSTPKPKPAVRRNKRKFHFVFTPTHKVTPQLKNSRKELLKGGMSNTELNKVDHRHSNGDADNNEIAMNSGDKSLDPRGLSTLDKNVTDLVNSEDSQHDCTDEHLFSTGCHQDNPTESDENIWQNYRPSYGGPYTCSFCYRVIHNRSNFSRHIASCKARISLSTRSTPKPKPAVRRNKRKFHFVFTPTHKVTPQLKNSRKELFKGGMSNTELNKVDHRHSNGDADNNEIAMNSGDKSLDPRGLSTLDKNVTDLVNSEDSQHDCTDEHLFSTGCHQDNPTEVDLIRTRKRTDYVKNNNSGIRKSGECLNGGGCMDNEMVSNLTWKEYSESVKLDSKVVENENIGQVVDEMKQISETHSSSNNSSILTGKTYSLGLRSRRLSLQSNQSIRNIETPSIISKLNRRKNRSVSPYSLRHPRIEEEISKCSRRSSVSTQSLSDNLIDDVRSIISNATTVPASDCSLKINESSSLFTCSWCNRSGFKCWRYLQIHRARCSSHPNRSNKQKSILSTNNISQVKTSVICEQCNREFRSGTGLKVHQTLMSHHNNKSFIHKNELSNNLLSQSIACPGCSHDSPLFESTEKLLKHLLTLKSTNTTTNTNHHHHHTNRSQYWPTVLSVPNLGYGCHICGMLLASESRLDKHKKAVHEVWLFQEQQNISPSKKLSTSTS
ncbi:unnamed protein product [Schistosoma margrebowiei]|uniref:C2H2-type domain-containing protein n=1 Tax=Schistosoma margrebowiei TaxID=48269 RepID=A0AA84ZH59_9TREM|nr:unnamed protein product [Schistosoma margrebowiei]